MCTSHSRHCSKNYSRHNASIPLVKVTSSIEEDSSKLFYVYTRTPMTLLHTHAYLFYCHPHSFNFHSVMDQHLPLNEAIRDMRMRAEASKERYISQAVRRPSRRRLVHPRPSSLRVVGSVIREKVDKSLARRRRGEFYSLHQPWPACYSCWAGPI